MNSFDSVDQAWGNLPDFLSWHVLLSVSALALGLLISLPLALLAARSRRVCAGRRSGFASIIQTIPSLALLALFYPVLLALSRFTQETFGFGFRALGFLPALLALTLYSMLPVLRNTITALEGIDPPVKMAARGVGMTPRQSLFQVELPLASPVIMAGIRTAAVWVIGTATLATPVGQTSLGNYIFTGLQTENWVFVLFGVFSAAGLAVIIDRLLALAEDGLARCARGRVHRGAGRPRHRHRRQPLPPMFGQRCAAIVIGTKSFDEQYILGNVLADKLGAAGFATTRRDGLGSTVIFRALAAGDLDVYVDYSGTIWANEMKRADSPGRAAVMAQMTDWAKKTYGIGYVGPLGFENAYAFAMPRAKAGCAAHQHAGRPRPLCAAAEDRRRLRDFLAARMARGGEGVWPQIRGAAAVPGEPDVQRAGRRRRRRDQRVLVRRPHRAIRPEGVGGPKGRPAAL